MSVNLGIEIPFEEGRPQFCGSVENINDAQFDGDCSIVFPGDCLLPLFLSLPLRAARFFVSQKIDVCARGNRFQMGLEFPDTKNMSKNIRVQQARKMSLSDNNADNFALDERIETSFRYCDFSYLRNLHLLRKSSMGSHVLLASMYATFRESMKIFDSGPKITRSHDRNSTNHSSSRRDIFPFCRK